MIAAAPGLVRESVSCSGVLPFCCAARLTTARPSMSCSTIAPAGGYWACRQARCKGGSLIAVPLVLTEACDEISSWTISTCSELMEASSGV